MYPVLFKIGPFAAHAYGFMLALGFLLGILTSIYFAKKESIKSETILNLAIYVIISAIAGARLLYVLVDWNYFSGHPLEIIMVQNGGLAFLGGLILSLLTILVYAKISKVPPLKILDAVTPAGFLGYSITRIGCFLNGCCFGVPTQLPWGIVFPPGSPAAAAFPGEALHPVEIYASLTTFAIFLVLTWIYRSKKFDGQIFFLGLIFYSIYRFLMEFLRFEPKWVSLSIYQWMVIPLFIFSVWGLSCFRRRSA